MTSQHLTPMSENQQFCSICHTSVPRFERYPRYLCMGCVSRAKSEDGRSLRFSNIDTTGGFIAQYADTGEPYPSHECYVDGLFCYADEGHFGGIVIQPI
jgi:hypothetical protein